MTALDYINAVLERTAEPQRCPAMMYGFSVVPASGEPVAVPTHQCAWEDGHPEPRYGMTHAMVAIEGN